MKQKFIGWVRYRTTDETGKNKVINEPYLVDGINFTDVESILTQHMKPVTDDFRIKRIGSTKIHDVLFSPLVNDDVESSFFEVKVEHILLFVADSMKEQKIKEVVAVESPSIGDAIIVAETELKDCSNLRVVAVKETKIVEYIK